MTVECPRTPVLTPAEEVDLASRIEAGLFADAILAGWPSEKEYQETDLERISAEGRQAWDEFWMRNIRLVSIIAFSWARRTQLDADELFQEGCIGLGQAMMRWDHRRGYRFSTFAWPLIEAEISRAALRRCGEIEASIFRLRDAVRVRRAQSLLANALGREASSKDLADHLGWSIRKVKEIVSLVPPGRLTEELVNTLAVTPDDPLIDDSEADLNAWMLCLPTMEREIVRALYGLDGRPAQRAELARSMEVSVSTVRRMEIRILAKLKKIAARQSGVLAVESLAG